MTVGRWEGDTLVVETTHIDWPYFDPYGTPQSDQMSYVETFRVADDDSRLDYTLVATGPVMFREPVRLERSWLWQPGLEMYEFDCVAEWENENQPEIATLVLDAFTRVQCAEGSDHKVPLAMMISAVTLK